MTVGHGAAAEKHGDLVAVDLVVLGLAAVNGLHVERMAQHERDVLAGAQSGQPVPGEHALHADDELLAVEADGVEEQVGSRGQVTMNECFARLVDDADVHCLGMQIDAAVECVLLCVESHHGPPWKGWRLSPQSARCPKQLACESSDIANNLGQSPPGSGGHDEYPGAAADGGA